MLQGLTGVTIGYRSLQRDTGEGYNRLQGLQGVTRVYRGLRGVSRGYRGLQEVKGCYKGL